MKIIYFLVRIVLVIVLTIVTFVFIFSFESIPERVSYGVSFSKFHSDELELPWREVYQAVLYDLEVKRLRLTAHWPMIEPENGRYSFEELDYQMDEARRAGASVILVVGRRTPGWPECHDPNWAKDLDIAEREKKILSYIEEVVMRYKDYENILYWQVENEPFLVGFSKHVCGPLRKEFLDQEIALVKSIDPGREILVTDSGELSTWHGAYKRGDAFGTSLYLYVWTHWGGQLRYPITPAFFRAKRNIISLLYGEKKTILIELSMEPWLLKPIVETDMDTLLDRMSITKFNNSLAFARKASFDTQYLWGVEWWYWMDAKGHPEYMEKARELFRDGI